MNAERRANTGNPIRLLFVLHSAFIALRSVEAADTTAPSTQPATVEFVSPEFRFRLRHPANWIRPEHPVNDQVFSVRTPDISPTDARFGVVGLKIDNGPEGQSDAATLL